MKPRSRTKASVPCARYGKHGHESSAQRPPEPTAFGEGKKGGGPRSFACVHLLSLSLSHRARTHEHLCARSQVADGTWRANAPLPPQNASSADPIPSTPTEQCARQSHCVCVCVCASSAVTSVFASVSRVFARPRALDGSSGCRPIREARRHVAHQRA